MFKQLCVLFSVVLLFNAALAFRLPRATSEESDEGTTFAGHLQPIFEKLARDDVDALTQADIDSFRTETLKKFPAEQVNNAVNILNKMTAAHPEEERINAYFELFGFTLNKLAKDFDKAFNELNAKFGEKKETVDHPSPAVTTKA